MLILKPLCLVLEALLVSKLLSNALANLGWIYLSVVIYCAEKTSFELADLTFLVL